MKQIIITSVFLLCLSLNAQTVTENYIHAVTYQKATQSSNLTNPDYTQYISSSNFLINGAGGGSSGIYIVDNSLTFTIYGSWAPTNNLKMGEIVMINTSPELPDMDLGELTQTDGTPIGINAKIESGALVLYDSGGYGYYPDWVSADFTENIIDTSISFNSSTGYIHECESGGSGGSSGGLSISNGIIEFNASGGWMTDLCSFRDGQIVYINTGTVPDIDLGAFKDTNGSDTSYRAKIENNWLVFYRDTSTISPTSCNYSINLPIVDNSAQAPIETITYYDGLGRAKQSVAVKAGGNEEDIIVPFIYDDFGRQALDYLPYARVNSSRSFEPQDSGFFELLDNQYLAKYAMDLDSGSPNPYSEKHFEESPLNRIEEQGAPGAIWKVNDLEMGHTLKFEYQTNSVEDQVRRFEVSFDGGFTDNPQLEDMDVYDPFELFKTIKKDENWQNGQTHPNDHTTEEFKDKQGRLILTRKSDAGKWHDTYYVYDDFGNLTYVLPPKMTTYKDITQQNWRGKNYDFFDVAGLFVSTLAYNEINFHFSPQGNLNFYLYAGGDEFELADGLVMNLDFINPSLPDMDLGNMYFDNGSYAGFAYIQSGNLYFDSSGQPDEISDEFYAYFSIDLSSYQNTFTAPLLDQIQLNNLGYQYKYDKRNRLVEKKIPGKGLEYIVYDELDRPVLTQDSNQRSTYPGKWLFTKYDIFGRVAYTGEYNYLASRVTMQSMVDTHNGPLWEERTPDTTYHPADSDTDIYYTSNVFPENINNIYTINYYDNYDFDIGLGTVESAFGIAPSDKVKGLVTGSNIRILNTNHWVKTVSYFDEKGRGIYIYSHNSFLETTEKLKIELDFGGNVNKTESTHKKGQNNSIVVSDYFTYDNMMRLSTHKQQIGSNTQELIVKNTYDEQGQLIGKDVGNTEVMPLQKIDYAYNIRGWLKTINNPSNLNGGTDLFAFGLNYDSPLGPSTASNFNKPLYNGNISHAYWKTDNESSSLKHYSYTYDALNRFTRAYFAENSSYNSKFNEYIYGYDRNGNIEGLYRTMQNPSNPNASVAIDQLKYSYDEGNKLLSVDDSYGLGMTGAEGFRDGNTIGDDFDYDTNGNMIEDKNKPFQITVSYNHLNLPSKISFDYDDEGYTEYFYSAMGSKIAKKFVSVDNNNIPVITSYAGSYIYVDNELKYFSQPEGYVEWDEQGGYEYIYQYKDHLGNIRLSYKDNDGDGIVKGASTAIFYEDFETASGWDSQGAMYGGSLSYGNEHTQSGDYAGKITNATSMDNYVHSNNWIPVNDAQATDYIIGGWVYSNGPNVRFLLFMNEDLETEYATLFETTNITYVKNKWVYLEKRVTVPTNIDKINFRVDASYGNPGTVWYDNLSIRRVNNTLDVEIVEENNYYPFGLNHIGYNNHIDGIHYPYKMFQGQEHTEELGLNVYEWKYRTSDPALGRFWQIDPLAEDYVYNSTYAFAENRVIDSAELEGLERIYAADGKFINQVGNSQEIRVMNNNNIDAKALISTANNTKLSSEERSQAASALNSASKHGYKNTDEAAKSFLNFNHVASQGANKEMGAAINEVRLFNAEGHELFESVAILGETVTGPTSSTVNALDLIKAGPLAGELSGLVHTHISGDSNSRYFSTHRGIDGSDLTQSQTYNVPVYISNNFGEARRGDFNQKGYSSGREGVVISENVPGARYGPNGEREIERIRRLYNKN